MGRQTELNLSLGSRGGRRPGSGRKRIHSPGVAHKTREMVTKRTPLHINFKVKTQIRNKVCLKILKRAVMNARSHGLRIIHFSLQSNHIHLVTEAVDNAVLTRGMRSLTITFSKGINKGRIQLERFHLHVLRTLREARNAIHYVLFNEQRHSKLKKAYVNEYSSLGTVQDLRKWAKETKLTIVIKKMDQVIPLDSPQSWFAKSVC